MKIAYKSVIIIDTRVLVSFSCKFLHHVKIMLLLYTRWRCLSNNQRYIIIMLLRVYTSYPVSIACFFAGAFQCTCVGNFALTQPMHGWVKKYPDLLLIFSPICILCMYIKMKRKVIACVLALRFVVCVRSAAARNVNFNLKIEILWKPQTHMHKTWQRRAR